MLHMHLRVYGFPVQGSLNFPPSSLFCQELMMAKAYKLNVKVIVAVNNRLQLVEQVRTCTDIIGALASVFASDADWGGHLGCVAVTPCVVIMLPFIYLFIY